MALDVATLAGLMKAELRGQGFMVNEYESWQRLCDALATAIVAHITTAAQAVGEDSRGDSHTLRVI